MQIDSIQSLVPDWFDPSVPSFSTPDSWAGCRVRVKVPITSADPAKEMADACVALEAKYPGALLHLVQDIDTAYPATASAVTGGDEDMLRAYFATVAMPEGSTREQAVAWLASMLPGGGLFGVQAATFVYATATNVLGFDEASIDMTRKGLTLVTGLRPDRDNRSNGAGKSTWVGLPFLGLTGRTFKNQEHDSWASRHNERPARLDTSMTLPDGRVLRVLRQRRPAKLQIWVDGADVTMGTPAASQKHVEQLTNLTWDVITNAVYIGQHEAASVFGADKERKELFSRLLGLNRFLDAQARIRRVSSRLDRAAASIAAEVMSAENVLAEVMRGRDELAAELKTIRKVDPNEVAKLERDIYICDKRTAKAMLEGAAYKKSYDELNAQLHAGEKERNLTYGSYRTVQNQYEESMRVGSTCVVCGGAVSAAHLGKYRAGIKAKADALRSSYGKIDAANMKLRDKIKAAVETMDACQGAIDDNALLKLDAKNALFNLSVQANERDGIRKALADKDERIARWRRAKSVHEAARAATLMEKAFTDACAAACGRDGLPAFLCAAAAPRLNAAAAFYRDAFESDLGVVFRPASDGIDVEVVNENGGESYRDQSKGETSLVGIITALAFREALVPLGVLVMDEPGDGLDPQAAASFAKGMNRVAERFGVVFVISHNPAIVAQLEPDRHVEIVKTGRVSVAREVV